MRAYRIFLLNGLFLGAAAFLAASPSGTGTAGADFLKILSSPRAAGMGGALAVSGDDLSSLELNPAGLAQLPGFMATASHAAYLQGLSLEQAGLGFKHPYGGSAFSVVMLSSPDITSLDEQGQEIGTFSLKDAAYTLGSAFSLGPLSLGASGKLINHSLAGLRAQGFGADLGAGLNLGFGLRLGAAAQNLGSLSALETEADPLPLTLRGGLAWQSNTQAPYGALVELDVVQPWDSTIQARGGVEARFQDLFFGRAGLQSEPGL